MVQPAKASELVTLTINGQEVKVPKGTNLVEAAKTVGVEVPHFCYHPGLSVVAVCRQCMVEVEGWPKLVAGCYQAAQDGMVVHTKSDKAKQAQRQMLEYTLVNHPVDCPICDQVGECDLQRYYYDYDFKPTRHSFDKVELRKAVEIGPRVTFDEERCIVCWRCIRVCDEVAKSHDLDLVNRGFTSLIATAPGRSLDNPYSLCTVDVCPVGALTETKFRFDTRVYHLRSTESICAGCATGCHVELHSHKGAVRRVMPRECPSVNQWWMCDDGRYIHEQYQGPARLQNALEGGKPVDAGAAVAEAGKILAAAGADTTVLLLSAQMSTEALYAARKLADELPGCLVIPTGRPNWKGDDILRDVDHNPNRAGLKLIFGDHLASPADLDQRQSSTGVKLLIAMGEEVNPGLAEEFEQVIAFSYRTDGLAAKATLAFPLAAWTEMDGTFINRKGQVGRFFQGVEPPGVALPGWEWVGAIAAAAEWNLGLGVSAREIYRAASDDHGDKVLPKKAFKSTRRPMLLRFAGARG